ncbi:uncharacterized protein LOC142612167 [Castanea sativa]|uniref:uncharacterized protein LOC142612167 n=1 Tax=Castanea sativa TaxID=21020 RepID=UPI003F654973
MDMDQISVWRAISVKSAYWLSRSSNPPPNQDLLRGQIWKTRIHERLKIVLWRVAANCLPTEDQRLRYDANADTSCHLCNTGQESTIHLFINCPLARALWFNSQWGIRIDNWGIRIDNVELSTPAQFNHFLLNPPFQETREDLLLFGALLCDLIWRLRNEALFEGRVASYEDLRVKIIRLFAKHRKARPSPQIRGSRVPAKQLKPRNGSLKINVDAAAGAHHSVVAVIARDWRGESVFACSKIVNTTLPLQTKAEALIWALQLAKPLKSAPIILECDSQVCYKSITGQGMDIP